MGPGSNAITVTIFSARTQCQSSSSYNEKLELAIILDDFETDFVIEPSYT